MISKTPVPNPNHLTAGHLPKWMKYAAIMVFVVIACVAAGSFFLEPEKPALGPAPQRGVADLLEAGRIKDQAFFMAQDFVRDHLKAPADAAFPASYDAGVVRDHGDGLYTVTSYVDAPNTFGAKIRTRYICKLQTIDKDETWSLEELDFDE